MTDPTVLLTGASGGIGSAVAEAFAAEGWRTVLCARSEAALESTAEAVSAAGGTPVVRPLDVRDENHVGVGEVLRTKIQDVRADIRIELLLDLDGGHFPAVRIGESSREATESGEQIETALCSHRLLVTRQSDHPRSPSRPEPAT